jgi:hypothetical protein
LPLVVSDIGLKMDEHDINFRKGTVPTETGIYFIHDYKDEYRKLGYQVLSETLMGP